MRENYMQVSLQVAPTPSFFENENAGRAFMYLSYWLAGLYVVSGEWQELKRSDPGVDDLLKSPHLEKLKRFRHGVYHFQSDYFDKRFMDALALGDDFSAWAKSLMLAFARYSDAWMKEPAAALSRVPSTQLIQERLKCRRSQAKQRSG